MEGMNLPECVCRSGSRSPKEYNLDSISIRDTASQLSKIRLTWSTPPKVVLIIYKEEIGEASSIANEISNLVCAKNPGTIVYLQTIPCPDDVDVIITVGGDGTVLLAAWKFQCVCPPILPLYCGTLGFLTVAPAEKFQSVVPLMLESNPRMNIRMRLTATIVDEDGRVVLMRTILNDITIDRGPSQHMSVLNIFGDGHFLTTLSGDGMVVATPTGSTAYSMSAGGSVVHPHVPGILITPICPHSLSFRPLIVPDWMELELLISPENRSKNLWVSFDGRERFETQRNQRLEIKMSPYPVSTICGSDPTLDWLSSLSRCLAYNQRDSSKYAPN